MSDILSAIDLPRQLQTPQRIVIKVGSALLLRADGTLNAPWLTSLCADIADLSAIGSKIIVVSSGAIGLGRGALNLVGRLRLEEKQAAAAAGQRLLMDAWQTALSPHEITVAQILLTLGDTENRRRYLNARDTIETLIGLNAIAIINENDTTATDEIRYGDNDRLAAHVAQMCSAAMLIMLSDVDGVYSADPRHNAAAKHIPIVNTITKEIEDAAGGANSSRGTGSGGMATKIAAAKIAVGAGCTAIVARGDVAHPLRTLKEGGLSTIFPPSLSPEKARRAWIAGRLSPRGTINIDAGAVTALRDGSSLLAVGVIGVDGNFEKGDAVTIKGPDGKLVAQGLCAYDSRELIAVLGLKSTEIDQTLGYRRAAVVHRNDMTLA